MVSVLCFDNHSDDCVPTNPQVIVIMFDKCRNNEIVAAFCRFEFLTFFGCLFMGWMT